MTGNLVQVNDPGPGAISRVKIYVDEHGAPIRTTANLLRYAFVHKKLERRANSWFPRERSGGFEFVTYPGPTEGGVPVPIPGTQTDSRPQQPAFTTDGPEPSETPEPPDTPDSIPTYVAFDLIANELEQRGHGGCDVSELSEATGGYGRDVIDYALGMLEDDGRIVRIGDHLTARRHYTPPRPQPRTPARDHCPEGHDITPGSAYRHQDPKTGRIYCRPCRADQKRAQRRKAAALARLR